MNRSPGMRAVAFACCMLVVPAILWAQSKPTVTLNVAPHPDPVVDHWASRQATAMLTVNCFASPVDAKLDAVISKDGAVVAQTKFNDMPVTSFPAGVTIVYADQLIPLASVKFYGDADKTVITTGQLPAGTYQICADIKNPQTGASLTGNPSCRTFQITSYQAPQLLQPANNAQLDLRTTPMPLFRWTPVTPAYTAPVTYKLMVFEVLTGQSPMLAYQVNAPIITDASAMAQHITSAGELAVLEPGRQYIWTVQSSDAEGNPIGERQGLAQPFTFTLAAAKETGTSATPAYTFVPQAVSLVFADSGAAKRIASPAETSDATNAPVCMGVVMNDGTKIRMHVVDLAVGDLDGDGVPDVCAYSVDDPTQSLGAKTMYMMSGNFSWGSGSWRGTGLTPLGGTLRVKTATVRADDAAMTKAQMHHSRPSSRMDADGDGIPDLVMMRTGKSMAASLLDDVDVGRDNNAGGAQRTHVGPKADSLAEVMGSGSSGTPSASRSAAPESLIVFRGLGSGWYEQPRMMPAPASAPPSASQSETQSATSDTASAPGAGELDLVSQLRTWQLKSAGTDGAVMTISVTSPSWKLISDQAHSGRQFPGLRDGYADNYFSEQLDENSIPQSPLLADPDQRGAESALLAAMSARMESMPARISMNVSVLRQIATSEGPRYGAIIIRGGVVVAACKSKETCGNGYNERSARVGSKALQLSDMCIMDPSFGDWLNAAAPTPMDLTVAMFDLTSHALIGTMAVRGASVNASGSKGQMSGNNPMYEGPDRLAAIAEGLDLHGRSIPENSLTVTGTPGGSATGYVVQYRETSLDFIPSLSGALDHATGAFDPQGNHVTLTVPVHLENGSDATMLIVGVLRPAAAAGVLPATPCTVQVNPTEAGTRTTLTVKTGGTSSAAGELALRGPRQTVSQRTYSAGHFSLEVDGKKKALQSVDGSSTPGATPGEIVLCARVDGGDALHEWISEFAHGKAARKSGSIVSADFDRRGKATLQFFDALITKIGIPGLDGASKDPAYFIIRVKPVKVKFFWDRTGTQDSSGVTSSAKQKMWHAANFRLKIDGLNVARVNKIDGFAIKQRIIEDPTEARSEREPAHLEIPDITLTMDAADVQPFRTAYAAVSRGASTTGWKGTLTLLEDDADVPLIVLPLHDLIVKSIDQPVAGNAGSVAVTVGSLTAPGTELSDATVMVDGTAVTGVTQITVPDDVSDVVAYSDGDDRPMRTRPGNKKGGTLTITKDWSNTSEWRQWRQTVVDGRPARRTITVTMPNGKGKSRSVTFHECWPVEYRPPNLNASSSGHAVERITIMYEEWK